MEDRQDKKGISVLVVMPVWHANFETRFFPLVEILRARGFSVDFRIFTQEMNRRKEIIVPAIPGERLNLPHFKKAGARSLNSLGEFYRCLLRNNLVVMGEGRHLRKAVSLIHGVGLPFIHVDDLGSIYTFYYQPDILVLPGEIFKKTQMFNSEVPEENIVVTGDIRFDSAGSPVPEEERRRFYEKYALDKDKKIALIFTGSIQRIDDWLKDLYKRIIACVGSSAFQPLLSLHPNDFAGRKRPPGVTVPSNKLFYPDIPCLEPFDTDVARRLCAIMLMVETSTCMEAVLYNKNAIVVNLHEWSLKKEHRQKAVFPRRRYKGCGLQGVFKGPDGLPLRSEYLNPLHSVYRTKEASGIGILERDWIGADCHIDELPHVLNQPEILEMDEAVRRAYIERYWHRDDGNAASRIADLVEKVAADERYSRRMFSSRLKRRIRNLCSRSRGLAQKAVKKCLGK